MSALAIMIQHTGWTVMGTIVTLSLVIVVMKKGMGKKSMYLAELSQVSLPLVWLLDPLDVGSCLLLAYIPHC